MHPPPTFPNHTSIKRPRLLPKNTLYHPATALPNNIHIPESEKYAPAVAVPVEPSPVPTPAPASIQSTPAPATNPLPTALAPPITQVQPVAAPVPAPKPLHLRLLLIRKKPPIWHCKPSSTASTASMAILILKEYNLALTSSRLVISTRESSWNWVRQHGLLMYYDINFGRLTTVDREITARCIAFLKLSTKTSGNLKSMSRRWPVGTLSPAQSTSKRFKMTF